MAYTIEWEVSGVYRKYQGLTTVAQRRQSFDEICGDRRFDDLRYAITDYLEVDTFEATDATTQEMAALHIGALATNPQLVIAAVATRPDILAYIHHFIALDFIRVPYRVFATLAEARQWVAER